MFFIMFIRLEDTVELYFEYYLVNKNIKKPDTVILLNATIMTIL